MRRHNRDHTNIKRSLAALTGAVTMLLALGAPQVSAAPQGFTAQARAAGLTSAEATALQAKVDRYLTKTGGTQISPNTIDLGNESTLRVTVPGEKHPRNLPGTRTASNPHCHSYGASSGYFCAYSGTNFTGDAIDMHTCSVHYGMPWSSTGSWDNHQRHARIARAMSGNTVIWTTDPARSKGYTEYWRPVDFIKLC
ncbi:peptidase inhibitor family I36 protein [Streptomyces sp. NPDC051018]|uniref:peptidase inhibitor family I36 protein n=1 Tax=Streptomyces sp. NPDC051018 TaxID=3365639 RepID=UPI0037A78BDD